MKVKDFLDFIWVHTQIGQNAEMLNALGSDPALKEHTIGELRACLEFFGVVKGQPKADTETREQIIKEFIDSGWSDPHKTAMLVDSIEFEAQNSKDKSRAISETLATLKKRLKIDDDDFEGIAALGRMEQLAAQDEEG